MKILEKEFEKKSTVHLYLYSVVYLCVCVWVRFFNFEFYPTLFFSEYVLICMALSYKT